MPRLHSRDRRLDGAAPPAQQGCVRRAGGGRSRRPVPGFPAHRRAVVGARLATHAAAPRHHAHSVRSRAPGPSAVLNARGALRSAPPRKARHA